MSKQIDKLRRRSGSLHASPSWFFLSVLLLSFPLLLLHLAAYGVSSFLQLYSDFKIITVGDVVVGAVHIVRKKANDCFCYRCCT